MKKKEIVIIGAGKFGSAIIENLKDNRRFKIYLIDNNEKILRNFGDVVDKVYHGDSSDEKFIKNIGVDSADIFVIGIGENIQNSILTSSIILKNFKGRVICKSSNAQHEDILRKIGVKEIVNPEAEAAKRAFFRIINPMNELKYLEKYNNEIYVTEFEGKISLLKFPAKKEWINKEIKDLKIENISIVLIYKSSNKVIIAKGDTKIEEGDYLLVVGKNSDIINFLE